VRRSSARPLGPARRAPAPGACPLSAHRRTGRVPRSPGHHLEGPGRGRPVRSGRGAAGRGSSHDLRRMVARPAVSLSPARRAAYEVVLRVFENGDYADRALATAARELDTRDRALAQQIAYGTVQRVRTLDHGIESLARRPLRKLDPPVRAALRTGAYQLAFLSGIARHAAVNET